MHAGRVVFSQLMDFAPKYEFRKCVARYRGEYKVRTFSCRDQFLAMSFGQLTHRRSLRDIQMCLRAMGPKLYHAGLRCTVSRSTLADANEHRDWRIYRDFAMVLIGRARKLYAGEEFGVALEQAAYALDSTTISLCLSLFPWARFRKHRAAVKLHVQMDLHGSIPCFIRITSGKQHDVHLLDHVVFEPGAFYVMDRAYAHFARLYTINKCGAFFITRAKGNLDYARQASRPVDRSTGLRSDQTIMLKGVRTAKDYPAVMRRVTFFDVETRRRLVFLTNNFALPALTIAQLYKRRWRIEIFFKWIKQHLRIQSFMGTSRNAVKTQIWIAISVYVLVAIVKAELRIPRTLYEILQILSLSLFEQVPLYQLLTTTEPENPEHRRCKQLTLFDL